MIHNDSKKAIAVKPAHPSGDAFRFGIEEEYFLVDTKTKAVAASVPSSLFAAANALSLGRGKKELLQQQLEVATRPNVDMTKARTELAQLRQMFGTVAASHGLALLAAGTHPTAAWTDARQSKTERYDAVMRDLQMIGRRNLLCGLHIHVELPDIEARIDVMARMLPYLPIFIALATSSPFWRSQRTGLLGYRLAAYDELPRTGVPELFRTQDEFNAYVEALISSGVIPDASFVWWAIRPSHAYPTLELRAPDSCTRLDDTMAITALYRALVRRVFCNPKLNAEPTVLSRALVVENKWRAQRYGIHGTFIDPAHLRPVPFAHWLEQVLDEVTGDAVALNCFDDLMQCRAIVSHGTSADVQLTIYRRARREGLEHERALAAVNNWLADATLAQVRDALPQVATAGRSSAPECPGQSSRPSARVKAVPVN